jgi:hypothetical protein
MALALTVKLANSRLLPTASETTTWPVVGVQGQGLAVAVPSLLTVLVVVMTALLPLLSTVASAPKVIAPT